MSKLKFRILDLVRVFWLIDLIRVYEVEKNEAKHVVRMEKGNADGSVNLVL